MLKLHALAPAATAAALASLPAAAWSAPATETSDAPVRLEGTYRHAGPPGRVQRVIDRAIERVVAQSPALFRPVVRQQLAAKTPPIQAVALALGPPIVVRFNDEVIYSTPADADFVLTRAPDRERVRLSQRWDGKVLVQLFVGKDGRRINRFQLGPDGRSLRLEVEVRSPRLPDVVRYELRFERTEG